MRRLMLLRHAKSDWPAGVEDHERPLAKRGLRDAPRMGKEMAARGLVPALVLVSTAMRTRQTWDLVRPSFGAVAERREKAIYEAQPEAILRVIRATPADMPSLLVIGHNPGLELTASFLAGDGPQHRALSVKFPTCALAVIDFEAQSWQEIGQGQGTLALFLTPAGLD